MGLFVWLIVLLSIAWGLADFMLDTARQKAPPPAPIRPAQTAKPPAPAPEPPAAAVTEAPADTPQGAKEQ